MLDSKFEFATKRVPTITIIDQDVNNLEEILKWFVEEQTHKDRRLIGFAAKFLGKITQKKKEIRLLDLQDRKQAMKEFFAILDEDITQIESEADPVLDLTEVVDDTPQIEDKSTK